MKYNVIKHEFVKLIPDLVQEGTLYISIPYTTATHKCFCGCGEIVVTPIIPTDWKLTWDGKTITLDPSIGSWTLPCMSHYFIVKNKVIWSRKWSNKEIKKGREKDKRNREDYEKMTFYAQSKKTKFSIYDKLRKIFGKI